MVEAVHVSYTLESCNSACLSYHSRISNIKFKEMSPVGDAVEVTNSVTLKEYMGQFLVAWMCRHCSVESVLHIPQIAKWPLPCRMIILRKFGREFLFLANPKEG